MKLKVIIVIVALTAGAGLVTVVIRHRQSSRMEKPQQQVEPTNMMRQMKPLTGPAIFPDKKK